MTIAFTNIFFVDKYVNPYECYLLLSEYVESLDIPFYAIIARKHNITYQEAKNLTYGYLYGRRESNDDFRTATECLVQRPSKSKEDIRTVREE